MIHPDWLFRSIFRVRVSDNLLSRQILTKTSGYPRVKRTLYLRPSNNTQSGDQHCEAMHFKSLDLTFRMLQHTFSKVSVIFLENYLNTIEIARDLGVIKSH